MHAKNLEKLNQELTCPICFMHFDVLKCYILLRRKPHTQSNHCRKGQICLCTMHWLLHSKWSTCTCSCGGLWCLYDLHCWNFSCVCD